MLIASQFAQLTPEVNGLITGQISDLCTTMRAQMDDVKTCVSSQLLTTNKEITSSASQINNSLSAQCEDIKEIKTKIVNLPATRAHDDLMSSSARLATSVDDSSADAQGDWVTIARNGRPQKADAASGSSVAPTPFNQQRRKIVGSKKSVGGKLASSSVGQWHVFIGRLNKDTEETDIKEFLRGNDVEVVSVFKLKASQPWQDKSAAFRVSVALKCKDTIMCSDFWPDNVEVRDWVFKPK